MSEYYYILDDMEKYFPNFNREEYEDKTYEELCAICRPHYATNPVDVMAWYKVNESDDKLAYKKYALEQILFIRNEICAIFTDKEYDVNHPEIKDMDFKTKLDHHVKYRKEHEPMVLAVSTHMSKSVLLPVMEINLKSVGVKILLRNNFYDWNISIESEKDIDCDFKDIFTDDDYKHCFCQGFPEERIYGKYEENHKKFTICIGYDYKLYTFMWLLADYLYKK